MTEYDKLIERAEDCAVKSMYYFQKRDFLLAEFWQRAFLGFKKKAVNIQLFFCGIKRGKTMKSKVSKCEKCKFIKMMKCENGLQAPFCSAYKKNGAKGIILYKGIEREVFCIFEKNRKSFSCFLKKNMPSFEETRTDREIIEKLKDYVKSVNSAVKHNKITKVLNKDDDYIKGGLFVIKCIEDILYEKPYTEDNTDYEYN